MTHESHESYVLSNDEPTAGSMLDCLSSILDDVTGARLAAAGVAGGARCLEVGAGNGSIAIWLADRVGPAGRVDATDKQPRHVRAYPRVTVLDHDVANEPLPAGPYDIIHARLLLAHLPERDEVLGKLAGALSPGGALVVEEWGAGPGRVLSTPDPEIAELYARYQEALLAVFRSAGNDTGWSARVHSAMVDIGLVDVETTVQARSWIGGSPGCLLPVLVSYELRDRLIGAGINGDELDRLRAALVDPRVVLLGNLTWSTTGRRAR